MSGTSKTKPKDTKNSTGKLLPTGNGGPGIDWAEVNKSMEPKKNGK